MSLRKLLPLAVAALITGCAPFGLYYREGVAVSRMNRDLTNCQVSALQKVPVAQEIRFTPRRMVSVRTCDKNGENCVIRYEWIGGDPYTVDRNKALREKVETQCMTDKGYTWVELPPCTSSVAASVPNTVTVVLPPLSEQSCAIQRGGGQWQIVTP